MEQKLARQKPKKRRKNKRKYYRALMVRGLVVLGLLLIIFLAFYLSARHYVKKHDNGVILNGVTIGRDDVSGLSKKQAEKKVLESLEKDKEKQILLVINEDEKEKISLGDLGVKIKDLSKLIDEAYSYGRSGSVFKNKRQIKKSEKNKFKKEIPYVYYCDAKGAEEGLNAALGKFLTGPVDAGVTMDGDAVKHIKEKKGEGLDMKPTIAALNKFFEEEWTGESGQVTVTVTLKDADITDDDLKDVNDLLGTFTTSYGVDSGGRGKNVEHGAELLSKKLIKPGEEMSVETAMGPRTPENGFYEAHSYAADEVVTSYGGGICQVSTTLYNALLNAELKVTQRASHSLKVGYVEISRDAAIAENLLDLKFENNLEYPIYIEGKTSGGYLTFNIYGKETRPEGRTLKFVGEVTDEKMPEKKKFEESDSAFGTMKTVVGPQPAVSARLVKYIYLNGEEQSQEVVNYSSYLETKEVVQVGVTSDNEEATAALKQAIQSQNETTINSVIEKYKAAEAGEEEAN